MASASHDIRLRRSKIVLINVHVWRTKDESLTKWFARIELPEEFRAGIDNNNADIVDFVFSERRIERAAFRIVLRHSTFAIICCR